jgi:hypothetical protein
MKADDMFKRLNKHKPFTLKHCFSKLQACEKWKAVRMLLNTEKNGPSKGPTASEGRPIANKKKKAIVTVVAHSKRVQSMVKKCFTEVKSGKAAREEKNDAR